MKLREGRERGGGLTTDLLAAALVVNVDGQTVEVVHIVLQRRPRLCINNQPSTYTLRFLLEAAGPQY